MAGRHSARSTASTPPTTAQHRRRFQVSSLSSCHAHRLRRHRRCPPGHREPRANRPAPPPPDILCSHRPLHQASTTIPTSFSGGEQQRVAVARAFASHPPPLLADTSDSTRPAHTSIGTITQLLYSHRTQPDHRDRGHHDTDGRQQDVSPCDRAKCGGDIIRDEADRDSAPKRDVPVTGPSAFKRETAAEANLAVGRRAPMKNSVSS